MLAMVSALAIPAAGQAADIEALEQRMTILEQQLERGTPAVDANRAEVPSVRLFGYTQFGASFGTATTPHQFAFDRVRLGAKGMIDDRIGYRVMVELLKLNKPARADTTVEGLLDAVIDWRATDWLKLSAGQFKTPFSMAYTTSAAKLDVIGFGMATNVSLDRGVGLMASGRNLGGLGLGYDAGIFNAGTRADGTAFTAGTLGHDDALVGRLLYDGFGKRLHLEGGVADASVSGGGAYRAFYAGVRLRYHPLELKGGWLQGSQGGRRTRVFYGQLLATLARHYELVGRWERTRYRNGGTTLTADNLIAGINAALYPDKPQQVRLQLNYIAARKDSASLGTQVGFRKGYPDSQVRLELQAGF